MIRVVCVRAQKQKKMEELPRNILELLCVRMCFLVS